MTWPITQSSRVAPGPSGGWTFGVLRSFQRDALGFLTEATATYGDIVRLQFGPITAHLVNHPSHVEQVLVRCSSEFDKRTRSVSKIRATCGDSLLSSEGRLWQKHRRIMQPLFRDKELARYIGTIEDAIEQMLRGWRVTAGQGEPVDMIHAMMGLTLNIATRVFFDCDIDRHTETIEHALKDILTDTWRRVESPVDLASMFPMLHRKAFRRAIADLDAIVYEIIAERRHRPRDAGDLLSRLLDANQATSDQQLSDRELRDAVLTLLLAGHETTANALTWAFCCISQSLAAEKRICDSVSMQYVGCDHQDDSVVTSAFYETLRLYPSIWIMERRALSHTTIGDYRIPRGSMVLISPYVLHRHPQFWHKPDEFLPDRFVDGSGHVEPDLGIQTRYAYLPFGAGPHRCIGEPLAKYVGVRVLTRVYREFRLRLLAAHTIRPIPGITLRHGDHVQFQLQRRAEHEGAGCDRS